ncbi:TonB-dependent receptor [Sphingomonas sp. HF-S4]|uniref:TonB-dependent receptor n=1 Tax=Sphingomonas agrestis TaxID=3080540 RepID=A0ABU3Y2Y4_9SPHN|nr:TonB-dependent receptor [Sphingomonas sp. HF-S4]MDV3455714.1 TonB-dependent receptor [Sphingomonas sp. HF-S4]
MRSSLLLSAAVLAIPAPAFAQQALEGATPATGQSAEATADQVDESGAENEIVVTGIRASLARAAEIKRDSPLVVDSIVAQDIGKFPDATTAAALQRVPGVQVTVGGNNEIVNPTIRGLGDILTTLDGREIFTTEGRGFAFQDLPAEALARVDVFKSNTANLIEGGVAGAIDLRLNKPFDYRDPTIAISGKLNYASNAEKLGPQLGFLATDRWDTGIGEIGALINVSWYDIKFNRPTNYVAERRAGSALGQPGVAVPISTGGLNEYGSYSRPQVNGSLQWQASPELQVYADGMYTAYRGKFTTAFYEYQLFNSDSLTSVTVDTNCFDARVNSAGFNPNSIELAAGNFTTRNLCNMTGGTFNNTSAFTSSQAKNNKTDSYLGAFGLKYDNGPLTLALDASYQKSIANNENFIIDIGKKVGSVTVDFDNPDHTATITAPGNPMASATGFAFINSLFQDYVRSEGDLFAVKADGAYEVGSILKTIEFGGRFADRGALFEQVQLGVTPPGGSGANLVSSANLPSDFLVRAPGIAQINLGAPFLIPNREYLLSDEGQSTLRSFFGAPAGRPAFDPSRRFEAAEKTYAGYLQAGYEIPLGGITIDGKVGVRYTRTDRDIAGAAFVTPAPTPADPNPARVLTPYAASTSDDDWLPNASARIQFGGGLQARATYSKTIARPSFGSLNPGLNYIVSTNPNIRNGGSGGNPDLKPQMSDSFDATLEYYFKSGYLAIGGYYRDIKNRVFNDVTAETINGVVYNISRPRNVGEATLKGIEVSGQTFFDFLPGDLAGFGVFGNFTYADSEVGGGDPMAGYSLQGVSKYNFNAGLLYDRKGVSARVVYTYRSEYFDENRTGSGDVRPVDQANWLNYVRPNGRLDFSLAYDVTPQFTLTAEGTNVLRSRYRSYINDSYFIRDTRTDDSVYAVGFRARF